MTMKGTKWKALVLSGVMMISSMMTNTMPVNAAEQFNGDYYGMDLDYHELNEMEMADGWSNGDMFNCTWRASNISFSDGNMNLKIDRDVNGGYSGGEYRTRQKFGYGMYDVKLKAIKNDGVVTSFFTYTGPTDGTIWDEIDIEILGKDTTQVQFNYYTDGVGGHEYVHNLGFDASQGFHQYGFLWLPGRITWYVDGEAVYTATKDIPTTPGKIMMNVWPGIGVDDWLKPYNGATPLTAQYEWASFTKVNMDSSDNNTSDNGSSDNSSSDNGYVDNNYSDNLFDRAKNYRIISKHSGKALDVSWGSADNGANILQYTYCGYPNQKWNLIKLDNSNYTIKSVATGKVVEVEGKSTTNGGNIIQWENNYEPNQQWQIEPVGDGYYKIINVNSGKALDVANWSYEDNGNIAQWEYKAADNQFWKIEVVE